MKILLLGVLLLSSNSFANEIASHDCLVLKGARVASVSLPGTADGYGNSKYWVKIFEINRNKFHIIAIDLKFRVAKLLQSNGKRIALEQIANNVLDYTTGGYGDVDYWISQIRNQNRMLISAAENLVALVNLTCE